MKPITAYRYLTLALILLANLAGWAYFNRAVDEVSWSGRMAGVSFSPYRKGQDPLAERYPSLEEIDGDLAFLQGKVNRVRTYSSTGVLADIPRLAQRYGLQVTAGAWLDRRPDNNALELEGLIRNARSYRNIERLVVGNEALLRGDLSVAELTTKLREVRRATRLPVSTAEPWHVWLKHPELAREVDYLAVHILPYWEELSIDNAMGFVQETYQKLRQRFPGKPILIAEVGWPSGGNRLEDAVASRVNQARFLRQFLNLASEKHYDYFLMEAFDQPWKRPMEGPAGMHWGVWDVERQPKFPMAGPITENPLWPVQATLALLLALIPAVWFLRTQRHLRTRGHLSMTLLFQAAGSLLAWNLFLPLIRDPGLGGLALWGFLLAAQVVLLLVILVNGFELAEMLWSRRFKRLFSPVNPLSTQRFPKVSIHLAIYNEPAELVNQTLDSLAGLDYPDFEVIVVDNNTPDPAVWEPVQAHCRTLGSRFRFYSLGKWSGYKAGALNFALRETARDAEVVAVVDSDYVVEPDWLRRMVPHFNRPGVGFVQSPQDHRDWAHDRFQEMANWEYAGFFNIGMVHRNERNAIIQHGTMTLIRKRALDEVGGWSQWCICEDAELGLRLFDRGYEAVYVNHVFGRGLTPHSFTAYKKQRFRWAYGAMQIMRAHWRSLLPGSGSNLDAAQRYHFLMGWLPWVAESLHLVFTGVALAWTLALLLFPAYVDFPPVALLLPIFGILLFKVAHTLALYRRRVPCTLRQRIGAAIAGMSLTHAIGRAMLTGLFTSGLPFLRTPKAEDKPALVRGFAMAREETLALLGLWVAAGAILLAFGRGGLEVQLWGAVMVVQSLPYLAALYTSLMNVLPARRGQAARTPLPAATPAASATGLGVPQEVAQSA